MQALIGVVKASRSIVDSGQHDGSMGIMLFVVTDDQTALKSQLQQSGQTSFGAAGALRSFLLCTDGFVVLCTCSNVICFVHQYFTSYHWACK
jgi:hypothetical protein